ncbi:triose-phosphate isomerase [bacterium M21]|nr:triose-phosphate isomerase [bacterium M21]
MARKLFIAGNWKLNHNAAKAVEVVNELKAAVADVSDIDIAVSPTFTSLGAAVEAAKGSNVMIGAQNIHWAANGAFTGEISADMLKEVGVDFAIIGHSERRQYFGETDETVNQRTKACLAGGLDAIVCVGETLEERQGGTMEKVIETQTRGGLAGISNEDMAGKVTVAYEPVWAIGTGETASPEQAQEVHAFIRGILTDMFGAEVAQAVRIQYGGSVKAGNVNELMGKEDIDGALVGGASLKAEDFAALVKNAK